MIRSVLAVTAGLAASGILAILSAMMMAVLGDGWFCIRIARPNQ
ncbi:MAG TPA: hypothetical protein VHA11_12700 [Bryobacteraceae bacterium]|nr:hypothetical protein [Bryobacteraceae bacterium]